MIIKGFSIEITVLNQFTYCDFGKGPFFIAFFREFASVCFVCKVISSCFICILLKKYYSDIKKIFNG